MNSDGLPEQLKQPSWRAAAAGMAARLHNDGYLPDPRWHRAFAEVPRHLLIPPVGDGRWENYSVTGSTDDWLVASYGIVVPEAASGGRIRGIGLHPDPGLLAWMLRMLGHRDRPMRVLVIGIGHGYLTALLCAYLGDDQVVVVETDPDRASATGAVLAGLGWSPQIVGPDDLDEPDQTGSDQTGLFDAVLVIGETPRSTIDLWRDRGAPWHRYLGLGGRLILGPGGHLDIGMGRTIYVSERAPNGRMGRVRASFDPHPLTDNDRLALAHLRQNPGLTTRLRQAHVAGADGYCQACDAGRHVHSYAPCNTRVLADTAYAATVSPPVTSALGTDPNPDQGIGPAAVAHLMTFPDALTNALTAHAVDAADTAGLCTGCGELGIMASTPCPVLTMAEIAKPRADSVRPVPRIHDEDDEEDDLPDPDPGPEQNVVTGLMTGPPVNQRRD